MGGIELALAHERLGDGFRYISGFGLKRGSPPQIELRLHKLALVEQQVPDRLQ
jgi:hypothetical protein